MELLNSLMIDCEYEVAVLSRHVDIENIKHFTENVFKSKSKIFVLASDILKVLRNHNYNWE